MAMNERLGANNVTVTDGMDGLAPAPLYLAPLDIEREFEVVVRYAAPGGDVSMSMRFRGAISLASRGVKVMERLARDICIEFGLGQVIVEATTANGETWAAVRTVTFPAMTVWAVGGASNGVRIAAYDGKGGRILAPEVVAHILACEGQLVAEMRLV